MPFKSQAQRRYLYSQHPEVAKEFEKATPEGKKLPPHVKGRGAKLAQEMHKEHTHTPGVKHG